MEPGPAERSRPLVAEADGMVETSFSSQIPHGRRLRKAGGGCGWGRACPSARVDGSGWVGLREGVRDMGESPELPPHQSTGKALKGKKGKQKEWTKENQLLDGLIPSFFLFFLSLSFPSPLFLLSQLLISFLYLSSNQSVAVKDASH